MISKGLIARIRAARGTALGADAGADAGAVSDRGFRGNAWIKSSPLHRAMLEKKKKKEAEKKAFGYLPPAAPNMPFSSPSNNALTPAANNGIALLQPQAPMGQPVQSQPVPQQQYTPVFAEGGIVRVLR